MALQKTSLEQSMDIIDAIRRGHNNPLKIMYEVGLNSYPFWSKISDLVALGYVDDLYKNHNSRDLAMFTITQKGYDVLQTYEKALEIVSIQFFN